MRIDELTLLAALGLVALLPYRLSAAQPATAVTAPAAAVPAAAGPAAPGLAAPVPATVKSLLSKELLGLPGKELIMLTVEYIPGGASLSHRHDAQVFVYVLEGEVVMQVKGAAAVNLHPGDTFYESPTDIHTISANASQTSPAKILVFMVKDKGAPATRAAQ